jgi:hypothetical protein
VRNIAQLDTGVGDSISGMVKLSISSVLGTGLLLLVGTGPVWGYVLWGGEHEGRAKELAKVYHETAAAHSLTPVKSADKTLTIWGHGGQTEFANMTSDQMIKLVIDWKKMNPSLTTVEIVTCDARHAQDATAASFAGRVAAGVHAKYPTLLVKGLPIGQHADDESVLFADSHGSNAGFCYLTGSKKAVFKEVHDRIMADHEPDASLVCNKIASGRAKEGPKAAQYTVTFGQLQNLRTSLVAVR